MVDWKSSIIVLFLTLTSIVFILNEERQNFKFELGSTTFKYHSNWTSSFEHLLMKNQLHEALKIDSIRNLDLSFAHSNLKPDFITELFQTPFASSLETVKLNLGSINLEIKDIEYLLSLIPNKIKKLQLHLDSINFGSGFGISLAYQLNRFTLLESLTVSLLLSLPKNPEEIGIFFKLHKPRENLKELNLILIGNDFQPLHFERFPTYMTKFDLTNLEINLYANKIGAQGAKFIAEGIKTQPHLKQLTVDLYFNNIGENGTKYICDQVSNLNQLQSLSLNFDFNYIKNEGGKFIGSMLQKVKNLKELEIGVASKNFGYLGFKSVIDGMKTQTELKKLSLRCGVNRVGINGANIVKNMLQSMTHLEFLNIGFVENYIGDEGLTILSESVSKMPNLKSLMLNLGFNDAKSYGLINTLKALSNGAYDYLFVSLSHNEFRDKDIQLIVKFIPQLIEKNKKFDLDFVDTAISKKLVKEIKNIFAQSNQQMNKKSELSINSVIPDEEKTSETLKIEETKSENKAKSHVEIQKKKHKKERQALQKEEKRRQEEDKRLEKERLEKERLEKERLEKERLEKERLEKERLEKERLEKERLEKERLEKERLEKEQKLRLEQQQRERIDRELKQQQAKAKLNEPSQLNETKIQQEEFIDPTPVEKQVALEFLE